MAEVSSQTLHLVARELNSELNEARAALETFGDQQENVTLLRKCAEHLHSVHGALRVAEVYGAALLAEEMGQAARYLIQNFAEKRHLAEGLDALMRAMVQLPTYLERVLSGGRDMALVLLPLLNDLRAVRGHALLSEGTLLLLNLSSDQQANPAPAAPGEAVQSVAQWARKLRTRFQLGLLGWIKGERVAQNIETLSRVAEKLEQVATTQPVFQLWWVVGAVLEALRDGGLEGSASIKRLLGQADRDLKRLYEQGEARYAESPALELLNNLLYYVARSRSSGPRVAAVRASFRLTELLPVDDDVEQARESLSAPSVKLMKTVAAAIKEDLGRVKDALDIFVRRGATQVEELSPQLDLLKKIADTLGVLGLGELRDKVQSETEGLQAMVAQQMPADEGALLRMAATLIKVEDSLDEQLVGMIVPTPQEAGAEASVVPPVEDIEFRQVTEAVLRECIVNMARIKEAIALSVEKPREAQAVDQIPQLMRGITAGLLMLNKSRAVEVLEGIDRALRRFLLGESMTLPPEAVDRLADAIVAVEYYMETLQSGRADPWYMLDNAEACLRFLEQTQSVPRVDLARVQVDDQARTVVIEPLSQTVAAPTEAVQTAVLDPAAVVPPAAPPAPAPVATDREIDPEFLELFIEEAKDEIARLKQLFPLWDENPQDQDSLVSVRRSFHTLKGSGRMVGAQLIGDFAWAVENLLNRVINKTLERTPDMMALLRQAVAAVPELVEQLETGRELRMDVARLIADAQEMAGVRPSAPASAPPAPSRPAVAAATVVSQPAPAPAPGPESAPKPEPVNLDASGAAESAASSSMDPTLRDIYAKETAGHLATIRKYIAECGLGVAPYPVTDDLHRSCHTLSGTAKTAAVEAGIQIAGPLNRYVRKLYDNTVGLPEAGLAVLQDAVDAIQQVVDSMENSTTDLLNHERIVARLTALEAELDLEIAKLAEEIDATIAAASLPDIGTVVATDSPVVASDDEVIELPFQDPQAFDLLDLSFLDSTPATPTSASPEADSAEPAAGDDLDTSLVLEFNDEALEAAAADTIMAATQTVPPVLVDELRAEPPAQSDTVTAPQLRDALPETPLLNDEVVRASTAEPLDTELALEADQVLDVDGAVLVDADLEALGDTRIAPRPDASEFVLADETELPELSDDVEIVLSSDDVELEADAASPSEEFTVASSEEFLTEALAQTEPEFTEQSVDTPLELDAIVGGDEELEVAAEDSQPVALEAVDEPAEDLILAESASQAPVLEQEIGTAAAVAAPPSIEAEEDVDDTGFDPDIAAIFTDEATELLETAQNALSSWSRDRSNSAQVFELKRALHTLKGGARMAGIRAMGDLSHELESFMELVEAGQVQGDDAVFGALQDSLDELHRMRDTVSQGGRCRSARALIERIRVLAGHEPAAAAVTAQAPAAPSDAVTAPVEIPVLAEEATLGVGPEQQHDSAATGVVPMLTEPVHDAAVESAAATEAPLADDEPSAAIDIDVEFGADELGAPAPRIDALPAPPESESDSALDVAAVQPELPPDAAPDEAASAAESAIPALPPGREPQAQERQEFARVDAELLDNLLNNAGEVSIFRSRLEQQVSSIEFNLAELGRTVTRLKEQMRKLELETEAQILHRHQEEHPNRTDFDPLELDRYSSIQQLTRAFAESVSDVGSIEGLLENLTREAQNLLLQQSRVVTELQNGLMRTRMVPFQRHVQRLSRLVRQVAADTGKKAEFVVTGASGELDRQVLERMLPPFEHMLRNSVVHGIETPEERIAAGKNASGTIRVGLHREGSEMVIVLEDDGRGIDVNAVRTRAKQRGLLQPGHLISDEEALQLILEPGFSTASTVTQHAGRGVGMDVVVTEIKKLGGALFTESTVGQGVKFTIRLPFTLAITQALIVRTGEELYALPLPTVEGVARVPRSVVQQHLSEETPTFNYGGQVYRFQHLGAFIGGGPSVLPEADVSVPVILIRAGEHSTAVVTDELVGSREMVVKSVGPQVASIRGISGATILGDGRIVIILDMGALVRSEWRSRPALAAAQEEKRTFALVVDDSITVRRVTQRLLERNGMKVMTAKDGVDALSILQDHLPDIILLDIEMPRMDGYELAQHVRADARLANIPIVMITSRVGEKHRARAIELGVDDYLGKPYQENQLLDAIEPLVQARRQRAT